MEFSLWLMPKADTAARIYQSIDYFSKKHGGPVFPTHCTLLGSTGKDFAGTMKGAETLAAQLERHYIRFDKVSFKDAYFQCVFLLCEKGEKLLEARSAAEKIFQIPAQQYMPHVSLMYSDVDTEIRTAAVSEAKERLFGESCGDEEVKLIEPGFWAESLQVWRVFPKDKKLESWENVGEFKLS
ncbi:hypothetical protein BSKO_10894 [Bryopsis sp. KO-2023]|nr:hypothetical protein BSKO_10894 [Bryopsis sp. KO-2023]